MWRWIKSSNFICWLNKLFTCLKWTSIQLIWDNLIVSKGAWVLHSSKLFLIGKIYTFVMFTHKKISKNRYIYLSTHFQQIKEKVSNSSAKTTYKIFLTSLIMEISLCIWSHLCHQYFLLLEQQCKFELSTFT